MTTYAERLKEEDKHREFLCSEKERIEDLMHGIMVRPENANKFKSWCFIFSLGKNLEDMYVYTHCASEKSNHICMELQKQAYSVLNNARVDRSDPGIDLSDLGGMPERWCFISEIEGISGAVVSHNFSSKFELMGILSRHG